MALTPEQQVQQAASQMADIARALATVANGLLSSSTTASTATKSSMDKYSRAVSDGADAFARSIKRTSEVLDLNELNEIIRADQRMFEEKLKRQTHFFNQEEYFHNQRLNQLADELQENKKEALRILTKARQDGTAETEARKLQTAKDRASKLKIKQDAAEAAAAAARGIKAAAQAKLQSAAEHGLSQAAYDIAADELAAAEQNAELQEKILAKTARVYDTAKRLEKKAENSVSAFTNQLTKAQVALEEAEVAIHHTAVAIEKSNLAEVFNKQARSLSEGIKGWFTGKFGQAAAAGMMGAGVKGFWDMAQASINNSMAIPSAGQQSQIAQLGMSPQEFMNATSEYRSSILAAGGLNNSMAVLSDTNDVLKGHVASLAESTKFGFQQMAMFTNMGIIPSTTMVRKMSKNYAELHQKTGMTIDQYNTSMRDIMENEDTLQTMRMANTVDERAAIAESIAARYTENRLRGINDEQTKAILKQQMKNANEKPLTRYQKAMKTAAYAGVMGVGGGSEHIRRMMKPSTAWTDEDRAADARFRGELSAGTHRGLNSSNFGVQLTTGQLSEKLGQDGPDAHVFNTTLAEPLRKSIVAGIAESLGVPAEQIVNANNALQTAMGYLKNPIIELVAGAALLTAGLIGQAAMLGFNILALNKNTAAIISQNPLGAGAGGPPAGPGKMGWKAGGLAGLKVGAPLAIIGGVVDAATMYDSKKQNGGEAIGSGVGTAMGGILGTAAAGAAGGMLGGPIGAAVGLVGGLLVGTVGAIYGGKIGASVGSLADKSPDEQIAQLQTTTPKPPAQQPHATVTPPTTQLTPAQAMSGDTSDQAATTPAGRAKLDDKRKVDMIDIASKQLDAATASTTKLTEINTNMNLLVELANKQLVISSMNDSEKSKQRESIAKRSGLQANTYQYI